MWDFFFKTENKDFTAFWNDRPAHQIRLDLPEGTFLGEALKAAHQAGVAIGSARSGIFEVQNDKGVFAHINNRSIEHAPANMTIFKTWDEIEREDNGC